MGAEKKVNPSDGSGELVIVTGSYGSGKTEYAVNLAGMARQQGGAVALVDLDVVNPYFRTRDVRERFAVLGIEVVAPEGGFAHADLPMLSPKVRGAISRKDRTVILDAGGDPMGARVLARYAEEIKGRGYDMVLVANTRRPDTRTVADLEAMMDAIEKASGLSIGRIMANSHLMAETTMEVIAEGLSVARQAARERGIGFSGTCVMADVLSRLGPLDLDGPVFVLEKFMRTPWQ